MITLKKNYLKMLIFVSILAPHFLETAATPRTATRTKNLFFMKNEEEKTSIPASTNSSSIQPAVTPVVTPAPENTSITPKVETSSSATPTPATPSAATVGPKESTTPTATEPLAVPTNAPVATPEPAVTPSTEPGTNPAVSEQSTGMPASDTTPTTSSQIVTPSISTPESAPVTVTPETTPTDVATTSTETTPSTTETNPETTTTEETSQEESTISDESTSEESPSVESEEEPLHDENEELSNELNEPVSEREIIIINNTGSLITIYGVCEDGQDKEIANNVGPLAQVVLSSDVKQVYVKEEHHEIQHHVTVDYENLSNNFPVDNETNLIDTDDVSTILTVERMVNLDDNESRLVLQSTSAQMQYGALIYNATSSEQTLKATFPHDATWFSTPKIYFKVPPMSAHMITFPLMNKDGIHSTVNLGLINSKMPIVINPPTEHNPQQRICCIFTLDEGDVLTDVTEQFE